MRALQMDGGVLTALDQREVAEIGGGMPLLAAALLISGAIGGVAVVGIVVGVAFYVYTH